MDIDHDDSKDSVSVKGRDDAWLEFEPLLYRRQPQSFCHVSHVTPVSLLAYSTLTEVLVLAASASLLLLALVTPATTFKAADFKTCSKSGFCRRGHALASRARENVDKWHSPYSADPQSLSLVPERASLTARVNSELHPNIKFSLEVHVQEDGVIRVRMHEVDGLRKRYDEALAAEPSISTGIQWKVGASQACAAFGQQLEHDVVVDFKPLRARTSRQQAPRTVSPRRTPQEHRARHSAPALLPPACMVHRIPQDQYHWTSRLAVRALVT
jgi:hypothetical protein